MTLEMVKAFSLRFDTVLMNRGPLVLPALFIHANKAFTGQILGSEPRLKGFFPTSGFEDKTRTDSKYQYCVVFLPGSTCHV